MRDYKQETEKRITLQKSEDASQVWKNGCVP